MTAADGAYAWAFLRCDRRYRAAWRENAAPSAYEDAPFPVRIRSEADLAAEGAWRLLAWEDPDGGYASPFFADAPMLEGVGSPRATPLLALLADAGAKVDGLRLADGVLVLKVEKNGRAVQVRLDDDGPLMAGGGVRLIHEWGLSLPVDITRLTDMWSIFGGPVPQNGFGGRGRETVTTENF